MSAAPLPRPEFERRNGFQQLPHNSLWDWSRLASGDAQTLSILYINAELYCPRPKGTPPPRWTRAIPTEEFAAFARCTVRAIQTAFEDLIERKVIVRRKMAGGYAYGIPFESWPELPDRPSKVVELPEAAPKPADEETDEETKRTRGEVVPVYTEPQHIKPGKRTRRKELPNCKSACYIQVEVEGEIAQQVYPYLCDEVLVVRIKGEQPENTRRTPKAETTKPIAFPDSQAVETTKPFQIFESSWLSRGINASPEDWALSRKEWAKLDTAEQIAAVQGVNARFEQGEYDEPRYIPLPQNYLAKKTWMRPVRGRARYPASKDEQFRLKVERGLARARALDEAERKQKQ